MSVFGQTYAGAYDALYGDKDYAGECDMIEALLAEFGETARPRRLLDLGCGTGNHAIPLALRGYAVTGIDRSPAMLAQARAKAGFANAGGIVFREGDARTVRLDGGPYDAAIMMFAVLGYQRTDDEVRAALSTVRAHLAPGGLFIFDIWYGPGVESDPPGTRERVVETTGGRIVRTADGCLDAVRHLCTVRYELNRWAEGELTESAREEHVMRYFFRDEIERFAADCGFMCRAIRALPDWRLSVDSTAWNAVGVFQAI